MKVSLFKSVFNTAPMATKEIFAALDRIRDGKSKNLIHKIRLEVNPEIQAELKKKLPVVCFNGVFLARKNDQIKKPSGLMIMDFDKLENPVEFKNSLSNDPYIFSTWISPTGKGVKALIKIPPTNKDDEFKGIFKAVKQKYPLMDDSGKDLARACFESFDPDIYINIESKKFIYVPDEINDFEMKIGVETNVPIKDQDEIANRLMVWFKKHYDSNNRNNSLYKLASAFNDFGVSITTTETYLNFFAEPDFNEKEIELIIKSAYKKTSQFGTRFFEDKPKREKIKNMVISGRSEDEINSEFTDIDKKKLKIEIEQVKKNIDISVFWEYDKKGDIKISPYRLKIFLESMDYYKYFPIDKSKPFIFITQKDNFINGVSEYEIKDMLMKNVVENNKIDVFNSLANQTRLFTPQFLSMLETANVEIQRDGEDFAMIYYQNNAIKVKKDCYEIYDYTELDGFVWEKQVIKRDFVKCDHHESMFRSFVWFISGQEVERYNTFKSIIGYLLHSYKTSANNRAIILNDEIISDAPNGGSGKGILINAIGHMKRLSVIDGKTFDFNKSFAYQTVSTDCQVLFYDDVKKNFEFERLFSQITEGFTIEYKNQGAVKLPVKDSPKLVISTNYTIKTNGGSFERRVFEIELSNYFNANHTPIDQFNTMLFDGWDDEEWSRFDMFMINCLQYYLENGLVKSKPKNLKTKKFINDTCQEFFDFIEDNNINLNTRIVKGEIYQKFKDENEELKWLSKRIFLKWIKIYSEFKGYAFEEGNTNGSRWFTLNDPNTPTIETQPTEAPF
jgi:hypothetical protein